MSRPSHYRHLRTLLFALWALCASSGLIAGETAELPRTVVYHIDNSERAIAMLRNISNHHAADPTIRIVVVALAAGVDFLIDGHADDRGNSFDALVDPLMLEGVEFRVCGNTLNGRDIDAATLLPEVQIVPSGVAEIARLQIAESAAYIKP
jgi:uncharacterized protein